MIDLHSHILPNIDDGSRSVEESLSMLMSLKEQGSIGVFCTSHGLFVEGAVDEYRQAFSSFKRLANSLVPEIELYLGSEVRFRVEKLEEMIAKLKAGDCLTMNDTKYILTECSWHVSPDGIIQIAERLLEEGYIPIFAHIERYTDIFVGDTVERLIKMGAMIQVNAYSLGEGKDSDYGKNALELLSKKQIHFLGSDCHNLTTRAPAIKCGLDYIKSATSEDYFADIAYKNAQKYLGCK